MWWYMYIKDYRYLYVISCFPLLQSFSIYLPPSVVIWTCSSLSVRWCSWYRPKTWKSMCNKYFTCLKFLYSSTLWQWELLTNPTPGHTLKEVYKMFIVSGLWVHGIVVYMSALNIRNLPFITVHKNHAMDWAGFCTWFRFESNACMCMYFFHSGKKKSWHTMT